MTKDQANSIRVGVECWSQATGLGEPYPVTEIINSGPRNPYFVLRGASISYRDVTRCVNMPNCSTGPRRVMTQAERRELRRVRRRRRDAMRKDAGA